MTHIATSEWIEFVEEIAGGLLFFVCPMLFFLGAWLVDRRVRRHCVSASKRWFALAIFSAVVLAVFAALLHAPLSWQFSTRSSTVGAISYTVGLGWLATPLIAVPCIIAGICGGIIFHMLAARRATAAQ
jgi:quinol-cytochrome oxidoreductase complex cytochrome b subunit